MRKMVPTEGRMIRMNQSRPFIPLCSASRYTSQPMARRRAHQRSTILHRKRESEPGFHIVMSVPEGVHEAVHGGVMCRTR
ncbi:hypothetical protein [Methanofollis ethanolicus]|uniref:hypothetical protein n=1 Tax=Methanofollis ethanolicus TaxID=488124 RepID=UPI00191BE835|nr:hypothetical protein [Methanofollis ethanolicus]